MTQAQAFKASLLGAVKMLEQAQEQLHPTNQGTGPIACRQLRQMCDALDSLVEGIETGDVPFSVLQERKVSDIDTLCGQDEKAS